MKNNMKKFLKDESGAAIVEYVLLLVMVALAGYGAVKTLGSNISAQFSTVALSLK